VVRACVSAAVGLGWRRVSGWLPRPWVRRKDPRLALVEDIIKGLELGAVVKSANTFTVGRRDDGTVLEVDLGDPETV